MTHYFTANQALKSAPKTFKYRFSAEEFTFVSDYGVFAKDYVDYGSYLLLKTVFKKALGARILDLGCGYGVIGIVLSRYNPLALIDAVDVNPRAITLTEQNAAINHASINTYLTTDITTLGKTYTSILLNPPIHGGKSLIYALYAQAAKVLEKEGKLYLVIKKKHGAEATVRKLTEIFATVTVLDKVSGYWLIEATEYNLF